MKTIRCFLLSALAALLATANAHAGLTLNLTIYRSQFSYFYFVSAATNATAPEVPFGDYLIVSPQYPTNGSGTRFNLSASGISGLPGLGASGTSDFATFMNGLTNGPWRIEVTNASPSFSNTYYFNVSAPTFAPNHLPATTVTYPLANQSNVTNRPTFTWNGPADWQGTLYVQAYSEDFGFYEGTLLPVSDTSWTPSGTLPSGTNNIYVSYRSNATASISLSTPLDGGANPIGGWSGTSSLESFDVSKFLVGTPTPPGAAALFGHYRFDDSGNPRLDSSGLGHDATSVFYVGGGTQFPQYDPSGVVGGAIEFDGYNALFWENEMTNVFTGSYSVSLWLKTSGAYGTDSGSVYDGAGILNAQGDPMPMVQTGSKLAFANGFGDILRSTASINSGTFRHLVITRNSVTGERQIYVDGVLDASDFAAPGVVPAASEIDLGYNFAVGDGVAGVVDDMQVYTSVLTAAQVQYLFANPGSTAPSVSGSGHTLKAHYTFESSGFLGLDSSPNGYHITAGGIWGSPVHLYAPDAAAGVGAVEFFGVSSMDLPSELFPTLAGSFSVSAWIKTSQLDGSDSDEGFNGAGIIWAELPGVAKDVVPLALTGSKAAFFTGDPVDLFGDTLHSSANVSGLGGYVHVVVTRDALSGEKKLYLNGALDATGSGYPGLLDDFANVGDLRFGGVAGNSYEGLLDDVQFYSGILNAAEVASLFANPGSTIPDTVVGDPELANAVDAPQLTWTSGGDATWSRQSLETHDGTDAAQSGAIDHDESSWIQTTVAGPGTLSFWWNVSSDDFDGYDYLEFTVDDNYESEIAGDWGWDYYEINIGPGLHTLRWTYYKDNDYTGGADAAWLDEVTFVPTIEVDMNLVIERVTDAVDGGFFAVPQVSYIAPDPITSHEVESPNGLFSYLNNGTNVYTAFATLPTFQDVVNELEDGDWKIYINRGHPSQRLYTFTVDVTTLDVTNLPPVNFTSPTEWETGIATNHTFVWTGPTNYNSLFLYSYQFDNGQPSGGVTNPAVNVTSTPMPNPLVVGTNAIYIAYTRDNVPGVTISDPVDSSSAPLSSWYSQVNLNSSHRRRFVVAGSSGPPATPVQIINAQHTGTNFSLSFLTQAGRTHTVQTRTNLSSAPWVDLSTVLGSGSSTQLFLPLGLGPESYFRVGTQ